MKLCLKQRDTEEEKGRRKSRNGKAKVRTVSSRPAWTTVFDPISVNKQAGE